MKENTTGVRGKGGRQTAFKVREMLLQDKQAYRVCFIRSISIHVRECRGTE